LRTGQWALGNVGVAEELCMVPRVASALRRAMRRARGPRRSTLPLALVAAAALCVASAVLAGLRTPELEAFASAQPLSVWSRAGDLRGRARLLAEKKPTAAGVTNDDFVAARDRIRRIQLGLGPNDPMPAEGMEAPEPVLAPQAAVKGDLELASTDIDEEAMRKVKVTGEMGTTDATEAASESDEPKDAFAGKADDVEEIKIAKQKEGKNIFVALKDDLGLVSWPTLPEVASTFGIVIGLVILYTGFVAVVDFGAQLTLGQVFEDFYKAAKPTDAE